MQILTDGKAVESLAQSVATLSTKAFTEEEKSSVEAAKNVVSTSVSPLKTDQNQGDCLESYEAFCAELGDWQGPLGDFLKKPAFKETYKFVKTEYGSQTVFPPKELIFNAFKHVQFS